MDFHNLFLADLASEVIKYDVPLANARKAIIADRKRRHEELIGKYIVVADGVSSKKLVYYQDPRYSRGGYWTEFITNARTYQTISQAERDMASIKLNNPRVGLVESKDTIRIVSRKDDN